MAFGFIKKVFSFGKKQVEERPAEDETLPPLNLDALEGFKGEAPGKPEPPAVSDAAAAEPEPATPPAPKPQPAPTPEILPEPHPEPQPAPELPSEPAPEEPRPVPPETPPEPELEPPAIPDPEIPAEPAEPQPLPEVPTKPAPEEPKPAPETPPEPEPEIPPAPEPAPEIPPQPAPNEVPAAPQPPRETPSAAETNSAATPALRDGGQTLPEDAATPQAEHLLLNGTESAAPVSPRKPEGKVSVAKAVERKQEPETVPEPVAAPRQSWFQRMRAGLSRSSRELTGNIAGIFTRRKLDEDTLQDLEDVLIRADLGVETAIRVTDALASGRYGRDISDAEVRGVMATEMEKVLAPVALPLELDLSMKPHVILVVGVNGTGKTTTIGKLAAKLTAGGLSVMLAAGDTFRAAAIEQLNIWGERTHSPVIASKLGADAAGLAYDAFEKAKEAGSDVLIIDTAGRLQNKAELMAELEKIVRVLGKLDPEAPHTVLQTVDATTGQNALNQVEIFRNVAGVNGLVLTKLDGTARGGILVAIAAKHRLPVYFIGVGEQVDDLEPFSAKEFADAIAGVA
jgi:fused signal recognition particle receptor